MNEKPKNEAISSAMKRTMKRRADAIKEWEGILPPNIAIHQAEWERSKVARMIIDAGLGVDIVAKVLGVSKVAAYPIVQHLDSKYFTDPKKWGWAQLDIKRLNAGYEWKSGDCVKAGGQK